MATRRRNDEEKLTDANIEKVISLLLAEKPATKKYCCELLGIAYNTTRLDKLIADYQQKKAKDAARRAEKRGKPATKDEISFVISEYLSGATVDSISNSIYRGAAFIHNVLESYGIPKRSNSYSYYTPELVPEMAMRDRFKVGEKVYSMKYASMARVEAETTDKRNLGFVYRVWLLAEKWNQSAYVEAFDLASLEHLREQGILV